MTKFRKKTAGEFAAELRADPEYVRQTGLLAQQSADRYAAAQAAARPVLEAIHKAGVLSVNTLWQMGNPLLAPNGSRLPTPGQRRHNESAVTARPADHLPTTLSSRRT
jgi:hypothetical protein